MTTPNLDELRARYTSTPVPSCRVCGGVLAPMQIRGVASTVYGCADAMSAPNPSPDWMTHYRMSTWTQPVHGDPEVLAAVDELTRMRALVAGLRELCRSDITFVRLAADEPADEDGQLLLPPLLAIAVVDVENLLATHLGPAAQ